MCTQAVINPTTFLFTEFIAALNATNTGTEFSITYSVCDRGFDTAAARQS